MAFGNNGQWVSKVDGAFQNCFVKGAMLFLMAGFPEGNPQLRSWQDSRLARAPEGWRSKTLARMRQTIDFREVSWGAAVLRRSTGTGYYYLPQIGVQVLGAS
jgi:hypothetical protein